MVGVKAGVMSGDSEGDRSAGIVHVVESAVADAPALAALLCAASGERSPRVVLIGSASAASAFVAAGCRVIGRVQPPLGDPRLGLRALRRALAAVEADGRVCWGSSIAAACVARIGGLDCWCATGAAEPLLRSEIAALAGVTIAATCDAHAEQCRACARSTLGAGEGSAIGRGLASVLRELRPSRPNGQDSVDRDARRRRRRSELGADDETTLVGVVGPLVAWTDLRRAMDIVGIAAVRGARVRLIASPAMARAAATARWVSEVGLAESPVVFDAIAHDPVALAEVIDVGLVLGDGTATAGAAARGARGRGVGGLLAAASIAPSVPVGHRGLTWQASWWAATGLPLIVEEGSFDAGGSSMTERGSPIGTFRRDDPLRATRVLLERSIRPVMGRVMSQD
jgi:hypothetical protein